MLVGSSNDRNVLLSVPTGESPSATLAAVGAESARVSFRARTRRVVAASVAMLLLAQAALLAFSAARHSPTDLEPALLAAGIANWKYGRFELYRVNPPLVRMAAALPALFVGSNNDWRAFSDAPGARPEFAVGNDFIHANGPSAIPLVVYARWACIPFSSIGAYFAYRWASELYNPGAGLVTLALYVFDPNLLAHGALITSDAAATSFGIVAGYFGSG